MISCQKCEVYDCSDKPLRISTPVINRKTSPSPFCPLPLCLLELSIWPHGSSIFTNLFSHKSETLSVIELVQNSSVKMVKIGACRPVPRYWASGRWQQGFSLWGLVVWRVLFQHIPQMLIWTEVFYDWSQVQSFRVLAMCLKTFQTGIQGVCVISVGR